MTILIDNHATSGDSVAHCCVFTVSQSVGSTSLYQAEITWTTMKHIHPPKMICDPLTSFIMRSKNQWHSQQPQL